MYNVEILLIRACKSNNPEKRLASVYRRFFYSGKMETFDLLIILNNLCETHLPNPLSTSGGCTQMRDQVR